MSDIAPTLTSGSSGASRRLSLVEMKLRAQAKQDEDREHARLKRDSLVLVLDFLAQNGYVDSLTRLQAESGVSLQKWQPADNVDLKMMLQEFESYWRLKFGKVPKLVRRATNDEPVEERGGGGAIRSSSASSAAQRSSASQSHHQQNPQQPPGGYGQLPPRPPASHTSSSSSSSFTGESGASSGETPKFGRRASSSSNVQGGSSANSSGSSANPGKAGSGSGVSSSSSASSLNDLIVGSSLTVGAAGGGSKGSAAASSSSSSSAGTGAGAGAAATSAGANDRKLLSKPGGHQQQHQQPAFSGVGGGGVSAARLNGEHVHLDSNLNPITSSSSSSSSSAKRGVVYAGSSSGGSSSGYNDNNSDDELDDFRLLRPLPSYSSLSGQHRELAEMIQRDIFTENPNVRFDDIIGLGQAKGLVQESIIFPMRFPELFTGLLAPWKGILLYGPPGVGKTLMAKAIATECKTTFFNISASSIVSKYRGDSEKLVRLLFEMARYHAPSTIFLDEIDSIMGTRDTVGEHEASRRMKTELLVQMDGLINSNNNNLSGFTNGSNSSGNNGGNGNRSNQVFVLAASNHPWHLDMALLRRLEKRILVPLPDESAREALIKHSLIPGKNSDNLDYSSLAKRTQGYSGADLVLLCKEAAMRPVRRLMSKVQAADSGAQTGASAAAALLSLQTEPEVAYPTLELVKQDDVEAALRCTRPSANAKFLDRYEKWEHDFGSGYSEFNDDFASADAVGADLRVSSSTASSASQQRTTASSPTASSSLASSSSQYQSIAGPSNTRKPPAASARQGAPSTNSTFPT